jgi:hypothetical protein
MNRVVPHQLWIGHAGEAADFRALFDQGVRAVVDVAVEEPPTAAPREIISCRFPLIDGPSNDPDVLLLAVRTTTALLERRIPTLVICGSGLSRSPAIAAAALSLLQGEPPERCLERVVAHHPSDVLPGLWDSVTRLLRSLS